MPEIAIVGADWLASEIEGLTDTINRVKPSVFNEENRYLPESVTPLPGYIRYSVNPFMREIVDCFDIDSPVREVNLKKGVQITYTTLLESGLLYFMAHVKTLPVMYITADKELSDARIENNFIPMINQSGFADSIRSSDEGNTRKTGKTAKHIQWEGGGYMVSFGARNPTKMRQFSICLMMKDELDDWDDFIDGCSDKLTDARCSGYWESRKIFRGGTPKDTPSKIEKAYRKGDQRKYLVLCKACSFPQEMRWQTENKANGVVGGFAWDMQEGTLILESVRYCCQNCGHPHYEHDKEQLFSEESGAHWNPTARPAEPNIRSYHLPAMYSPIGLQPWYKSVGDFLEAFDPVSKQVIDPAKYRVFRNNILAEPTKPIGSKVKFESVSAHRRQGYRFGEVPNKYAVQYCGSPVLFLTCTVDVHKRNIAVSVMGWTRQAKCFIIDYWLFERETETEDCREISHPVWARLRTLVEKKEYTADDGRLYKIALTLVDAGEANDTVNTFCSDYSEGVYPILGRDRSAKNLRISEFAEFKTQAGTRGYKIVVDHYKDRMARVLRREWVPEAGEQPIYHFNAPVDISDDQLMQFTREVLREKEDDKGRTVYYWHRLGNNADNTLWDLLGYGYAAVEILAQAICMKDFELEDVDWAKFWEYIETEELFFTTGGAK